MKTYDSTYTAAVVTGNVKTMAWAIRLWYDDESASLRFLSSGWSSSVITAHGGLVDVSFGESGFDPYSGANYNAHCTFALADEYVNSSYVTTALLSGKGFINRKIEVYRFVTSVSDAGTATPFVNDAEFSGIVTNFYYDIAKHSWIFDCEHLHQHRTIPQTVITKEAYPEAPDSAIGACLPLLYGTFTMSGTGTRADGAHGLNHLAPTVCINATKGIYAIAEHAVHTLGTDVSAVWIDGIRAYGHSVYVWDGATVTHPSATTTGPSFLQLPVPATNGIFRVESIWLMPKLKGIYNGVSGDSDDAVDGDYNTDLTIAASTRYAVKFPYGSIGGGGEFYIDATADATDIQVYAFFKAHSGSAIAGGFYNPIIAVNYSPGGVSGTGYASFSIGSPTSGKRSLTDGTTLASTDQWTWAELALYEFYLSVPAASSVDISTMGVRVNDLIISGQMTEIPPEDRPVRTRRQRPSNRREHVPSERVLYRFTADPATKERGLSNVFSQVTGRKFGAWIGSRNGLSTTNSIQTSNYIVESILRDEMGVADADIDETAFDGDYSDAYTMAFSLNKKESTQSVIQDIAFQSGCYVYRKSTGIWTTLRLPATPSAAAVEFDVTGGDVRLNKLSLTPHEYIQNEVRVLYNYDYALGEFTRDTTSADTTSKADGATGVNGTAITEIGADFLRKDSNGGATNFAVSLRDYLLANWAYPHYLLEFDINNPTYFNLEEGDIVQFNNVETNLGGIGAGSAGDYWSSFSGFRTEFWLIYSRLPMLHKVECKAIQLHDIS